MVDDNNERGWLLAHQRGVLSRAQALASGLSRETLRHRIRTGGPWQRLLPGIYLTATGEPTSEQVRIAAALYGGPESAITGRSALRNYGIRREEPRIVDVLVPASRSLAGSGFVSVHRTWRMPECLTCDGPVRFAPAERAVADTVRGIARLEDARAIVASAVQRGDCTIEHLLAELRAGPVRGSGTLRSVLAEVIAGIRSVPEAELRELIRRAGLPEPLYNPRLYLGGVFLAQPDAWWPDHGVAVEVDSREWHLSPADWERTMARHARMCAAGIVVLHFSPRQQREQPGDVTTTIASALRAGRPLPAVTTRRLAA
ncbi:MAG: hypothetical protein ACRDOK_11755 [Streptosporangiaceae bacterium]